jgi:hypothetical protein
VQFAAQTVNELQEAAGLGFDHGFHLESFPQAAVPFSSRFAYTFLPFFRTECPTTVTSQCGRNAAQPLPGAGKAAPHHLLRPSEAGRSLHNALVPANSALCKTRSFPAESSEDHCSAGKRPRAETLGPLYSP